MQNILTTRQITVSKSTKFLYTTTVEAIIGKIMELVKANKLKEISDARDETGLDGFQIALDLKYAALIPICL